MSQIRVRKALLGRLDAASRALPKGYQLVLTDGWRPKHVRQALFDDMRQQIAQANAHLSKVQIDDMTELYCTRVSDDPIQPGPHLTGGLVDVTLADESGRGLDMGSAFDEPARRSWTACELSETPTKNRDILHSAMTQVGFTNLPSECWHYDYGNWVWAWYS